MPAGTTRTPPNLVDAGFARWLPDRPAYVSGGEGADVLIGHSVGQHPDVLAGDPGSPIRKLSDKYDDAQKGEIRRMLKKWNDHRWDRAIDRIIDSEGRDVFTDKPGDPPTKSGVTLDAYRDWRRRHGGESLTDGKLYTELKNLPVETARKIMRTDFLERYHIDWLPDFEFAKHVLDATINPGSGLTIPWVMGELNAMYAAHEIDMPPISTEVEALGPEVRVRIEDAMRRGLMGELNDRLAQRREAHYLDRIENARRQNPERAKQMTGLPARARKYGKEGQSRTER